MAIFTAGAQGVDMSNFDLADLLDGDVQASSSQVKVVFDPTSYVAFGGNFTISGSGDITGGTITSVTSVDAGATLYTLTGTAVGAVDFVNWVESNNTVSALQALFKGDDQIDGGNGKDVLGGFDGNDVIKGDDGDDILLGFAGKDTLNGGAGKDTLNGGAGADSMTGGSGADVYVVDDKADKVTEKSHGGSDTIYSSVSYTLSSNVEFLGLTGTGKLKGTGNSRGNTLLGNDAANKLYGMGGADTLSGGKGDDHLIGGTGKDVLYGGAGKDSFAFDDGDFSGKTSKTADRIMDFAGGTDKIDLKAVDAKAGGADNKFKFIGTDAFSGHTGEVRYAFKDGHTLVSGDINGDKHADFMIYIEQKVDLVKGDFIL